MEIRNQRRLKLQQAIYGRALLLALIIALGLGQAPTQTQASDCSRTSVGLTPLNDLGSGLYRGSMGGLYSDGANARPEAHERAGLEIAPGIQPLNRDGKPDAQSGEIVLISIGMSNTTPEFSVFQQIADRDLDKNPKLVLVDGAQGGWSADRVVSNGQQFWATIEQRLTHAGLTPQQVQLAWLKQAPQPRLTLSFPEDARRLQSDLRIVVQTLKQRYPNIKIVYLSSRTYGGYASTDLNPEPYAYQSGFAVKWLIEEQINGSAELNFDATKGTVKAPWLSWGPYLWADGLKPRSDGLTWACSDFGNDGTHPSPAGRRKVAELLLKFLKSDLTATPWFLKATGLANANQPQPPPGGQGPFSHQIYSASSADGLNWTHDNRLLLDHASVPAAIVTPDGKIRIYYVDATQPPENTNCAESSDGGQTFKVLGCTISNRTAKKALDPSIVRLTDGRYRLYYYGAAEGDPNAPGTHTIYSAISDDGIRFTEEKAVFSYPGLVDPDVFWTGKEWLMFVFAGGGEGTIVARSQDGLSFKYVGPLNVQNWGTTAPVKLDDGRFRLYAFDQPAGQKVASFLASDGLTWQQEPGIRLTAPSGYQLTDPFVIQLPDGTWKMVYKVSREGRAQQLPPQVSNDRVFFTASTDGLNWGTPTLLSEKASVPDVIRTHQGVYWAYWVDFSNFTGPRTEKIGVARSTDGSTWEKLGTVQFKDLGSMVPVDPDVIELPDGRLRMYFYDITQDRGEHPIYSAVSSDGLTYTLEPGVRFKLERIFDPDVIKLKDGRYRMYLNNEGRIISATSAEGLTFAQDSGVRVERGGVPGSIVLNDGSVRLYGCGIDAYKSADGLNFSFEAQTNIRATPPAIVCDPAVTATPSGYLMVYKYNPGQ